MAIIKQNYLSNLNEYQKEAIINPDGPCLVVAGAGSGKTKVLTSRVAHIIKEKKAWPNQILCVTFTNKAAREMQDRIINSLNEKVSSLPWLGTFHSVCAKLLRRHAEAVGLNSKFTINKQKIKSLIKGYESVRKISFKEKKSLNILCRGAAMRYLLTRLYDYSNTPKTALIKIKNPNEYYQKLLTHNSLNSYKDYLPR